jgi:hypothetical protein
MKNHQSDRIGYVEWMMKIKSVYQYPSHIARGIEHLVNSDPVTLPEGIKKPKQ